MLHILLFLYEAKEEKTTNRQIKEAAAIIHVKK